MSTRAANIIFLTVKSAMRLFVVKHFYPMRYCLGMRLKHQKTLSYCVGGLDQLRVLSIATFVINGMKRSLTSGLPVLEWHRLGVKLACEQALIYGERSEPRGAGEKESSPFLSPLLVLASPPRTPVFASYSRVTSRDYPKWRYLARRLGSNEVGPHTNWSNS